MTDRKSHSKRLPESGLLSRALVDRCRQEAKPGPLISCFSTGIKQEPNRFVVPRTVMIGGKVRSQAADRGSDPLTAGLRSAWLGCRIRVGGQAVELTPDCAPTGCPWIPHG